MRSITFTAARYFVVSLCNILILLIISIDLQASGVGAYGLAILVPAMVFSFLNLGTSTSVVYYLSSKFMCLDRVAGSLFLILVPIFGFGYIFNGLLSSYLAPSDVLSEITWYAVLSFTTVTFLTINSITSAICQGQQRFSAMNFVLSVQPIVHLMAALYLMISGMGNLANYFYSYFFSHLASFFICAFFLSKEIGKIEFMRQEEFKHFAFFGIKSHVGNVVSFFIYRTDFLLISYFLGVEAAGVYFIALRIAEQGNILPNILATVIFPKLVNVGVKEGISSILSISGVLFYLMILFSTLLILLPDRFFESVLGDSFSSTQSIAAILFFGVAFSSASRILSIAFTANDQPEINTYFAIFVLIVNFLGNVMLIPAYGIQGAAVATCAAYILGLALRMLLVKRNWKISYLDFILPSVFDLRSACISLLFDLSGSDKSNKYQGKRK